MNLVYRRRRRRPVILTFVLRPLRCWRSRHRLRRLRRLRRMVATIQRQRYPDNQNANGGYTAGEESHQEAVIGRLVRDPATWGKQA